jgi:hypothetical protein
MSDFKIPDDITRGKFANMRYTKFNGTYMWYRITQRRPRKSCDTFINCILSMDTHKVVGVLPPEYTHSHNVEGDCEYTAYRCINGTKITLYYHDGSWKMATRRLPDCSTRVINNIVPITYKDAFHETLIQAAKQQDEKGDPEEVIQSFYDSLDPETSYTFGFNHESIHPLIDYDDYRVWFIQSSNHYETFDKLIKCHDLCSECKCIEVTLYEYDNSPIDWIKPLPIDEINPDKQYSVMMHPSNYFFKDILIESNLKKDLDRLYYNNKQLHEEADNRSVFDYMVYNAILSNTTNQYELFTVDWDKYREHIREFFNMLQSIPQTDIDEMLDTMCDDPKIMIAAYIRQLKFEDELDKFHQIACQEIARRAFITHLIDYQNAESSKLG